MTERRKTPPQGDLLGDRVLKCAKGTAFIHTATSADTFVRTQEGHTKAYNNGGKTFGDGMQYGARPPVFTLQNFHRNNRNDPDMVETISFISAGANRHNPYTELDEAGVYFEYGFFLLNSITMGRSGTLLYKDASSSRIGNCLLTRVLLPESLASGLRYAIEETPLLARQLAERIVLDLGGIAMGIWDGTKLPPQASARIQPPYEDLTDAHRLYLLEQVNRGVGQVLVATKIEQPFNAPMLHRNLFAPAA